MTRTIAFALVSLAAVAAHLGCGGPATPGGSGGSHGSGGAGSGASGSGTFTTACTVKSPEHVCVEASSTDSIFVGAYESGCAQAGNMVGDACDPSGTLGSCTQTTGGLTTTTYAYADTMTPAADLKAGCESAGGMWKDP